MVVAWAVAGVLGEAARVAVALASGVDGIAVAGGGVNVAGVLQARIAAISMRMAKVGFVLIEHLHAFNRLDFSSQAFGFVASYFGPV